MAGFLTGARGAEGLLGIVPLMEGRWTCVAIAAISCRTWRMSRAGFKLTVRSMPKFSESRLSCYGLFREFEKLKEILPGTRVDRGDQVSVDYDLMIVAGATVLQTLQNLLQAHYVISQSSRLGRDAAGINPASGVSNGLCGWISAGTGYALIATGMCGVICGTAC